MSMKIMQNYQYLMQAPNGSDQNLKNLALNSIHYQNCICKRFEGTEFFDKRNEHSNAFNKKTDGSVQQGKQLEMSDAFIKMREISEAANKRLGPHDLYANRIDTPVSYKKQNTDGSIQQGKQLEMSDAFIKMREISEAANKRLGPHELYTNRIDTPVSYKKQNTDGSIQQGKQLEMTDEFIKMREISETANKRIGPHDLYTNRIEAPVSYKKLNPDGSIQQGKQLEMSDAFIKMREISEAANKRLGPHDLHTNRIDTPVNYKKQNHEYIKRNESIDNSTAYSKEIAESNSYNKTISDNISINSRSEIANMYSGFETAEMYSKGNVSRLYGKDFSNSNLFAKRNVNLGFFSKNQSTDVYMIPNEASNFFLKRMGNPNVIGASMDNSNSILKRHENSDIFGKRIENPNLHDKGIESTHMYTKKAENSELYSKNAESDTLSPSEQSEMHSKSLQLAAYFDEDIQASLARKQLLAHASTKLNLCDICKKSFSTKGNLQNHHIVHSGHKPHECGVCKKTFSQRSTLGKHYLIHTGEKPHVCSVCGRGFRQANNLRIHFLTHSGEKPHLCNICDRAFTQKIALQKHLLTHTGIKPHECDVCKRCFTTKGNLQKHFLIHTGEKPHICNVCNRGFSQKIALKKHHLTHTGEKPHICNVCGKAFTTKGNLKSHYKRHTLEKLTSSLGQPVTSSSMAHSLLVPKSIAQSIMSPLIHDKEHAALVPNSVAISTSVPTTLAELKSVLPVSSHMDHPLALINPITSSVSQIGSPSISMAQSFSPSKPRMATYYTTPNEHYSFSSPSPHNIPSVPFSQPQNLTMSHQIPIFHSPTLTITASSSPFPTHLQNENTSSSSTMQSHVTQTSESANSLTSQTHKPVFAASQSLQQHSRPSLPPSLTKSPVHSMSCEEPLGLDAPDSPGLTLQITNVRSVSPLQTPCSVALSPNSCCDKVENAEMSDAQGQNVPTSLSQNLSIQTSQVAEDNKEHQHITIL